MSGPAALLRRDDGFTMVETAWAALLGLVALGLVTALLIATNNTSLFTQGQSVTLDDSRMAMQQIEKELRGSDFINWCTPAGSCLEVGANTPSGNFQTVRYTHTTDRLVRQVFDTGTNDWGEEQVVIDRVVNPAAQPVFSCDTNTTLLRVNIDLIIQPSPHSEPTFNVTTSLRPRNFPSAANCP